MVVATNGRPFDMDAAVQARADRVDLPRRCAPDRQGGFTYLGLLFVIAIMGAALAGIATVWDTYARREKEAELLFIGDQFRLAIGTYYERTPGGVKQYPKQLEDLLKDPRFPDVQRHLRRVYVDPMTGKTTWGLIRSGDGGILGVHSLSEGKPIKVAGFDAAYASLAKASTYSNWFFVYMPGDPTGAGNGFQQAQTSGGVNPMNPIGGPNSGNMSTPMVTGGMDPRAPICEEQRTRDLLACNGSSMGTPGGSDNCILDAIRRFDVCLVGGGPQAGQQ